MEYKKAMGILLKIIDKYSLDAEEKKAIWTAMGTLDCGSLAENRLKGIIKGRKAKQKNNIE